MIARAQYQETETKLPEEEVMRTGWLAAVDLGPVPPGSQPYPGAVGGGTALSPVGATISLLGAVRFTNI